MEFHLKTFDQLSGQEVYVILKLRSQVFVVEQACVYLDSDGLDIEAHHLFAFDKEELVSYCRILAPGIAYKQPAIGRVVVDERFRKQKIGEKLMQTAIQKTTELFNCQEIIISAQMYLLKFYSQLGFVTSGESYLEDGIPHIKMTYSTVIK